MATSSNAPHRISCDLCIIGAGAAGLSVAAGAAQMGAKVVLIEKTMRQDEYMGGECLHTGCVPSKAMLAAGKQAVAMGAAERFGIANAVPQVDFAKVNDHVHDVIQAIAPTDSVERFEKLGVTVLQATARFIDGRTVDAGEVQVRAKRFVLATGSEPMVPPITGLDTVPYLTNETVFENRTQPDHLIVIGAGPIGLELAQAHRRLGSQVTVLEKFKAMPKDDPELACVVLDALRKDGVALLEEVEISGISSDAQGRITVAYSQDGQATSITGSHLLVATGRKPVVSSLDLEAAGVEYSPKGIVVDARLRTSNKKIFAIGDCVANSLQFTHVAGYHAGIVIRNALFRVPAKSDLSQTPWVTYTDPELAHVGLNEAQAREQHGDDVKIARWDYEENDRARAERETVGKIKVVARNNGKILGVSIVGAHAGEVIQPWLLALSKGMKMSDMTGYIAPYPTLGELNKRAAGEFYTDTLFGPRVKFLVRLLLRLP